MNEQIWWFVARASGMVAAVLIGVTVVWGTRRPRDGVVTDSTGERGGVGWSGGVVPPGLVRRPPSCLPTSRLR